jgi:tRNA-dihydrouridine synthase C
MTLILAPMEGLLDFVLRDVLTRVGGVDRCVSEFIRITNTLMPERAFIRVMPELLHGGKTPSGVPVRAQLLGSDPVCIAENAARLAALGPHGIDLNFGCPAKVVNRHGGGAALLEDPELLTRIVSAVRRAVPSGMPVSAKMRLGLHDDRRAEECALALEAGGAAEIVVHARTKADAYRPPAYWSRIADIRAVVRVPVIANGEIWNLQDALRCRTESGCTDLMLGRGLVTDPGLALAIRAHDAQATTNPSMRSDPLPLTIQAPFVSWESLAPHMADFWQIVCTGLERKQQAGRLKQWLNFLRRRYPEAQTAYEQVKGLTNPRDVDAWFARNRAT